MDIRAILQGVDVGVVAPPTLDTLLHTLNNPNAYGTTAYDNFGHSVSISDTYCVVGADGEYGSAGKAYIFSNSTGELLYTLDDPNAYGTTSSDYFGYSVAITDNYCVVGAYLEDDAGGSASGKAYIFLSTTGALLHTLNNPNAYSTSANDYFGYSVAISPTYCIVGAYLEDDGGSASGKAYIFSNSTGALLRTLNNPNAYGTSADDNFGYSVAITDNYCVVGAPYEDDASGTSAGKAYIFSSTTGALLYTLNNPNPYSTSVNDYFGHSVAITDSYCIIGAPSEDDAGGTESGKAYIFDMDTGLLLSTLNNPNAYSTTLGDGFGTSVAISSTYCIIGAPYEDDASGNSSGKAYIFDMDSGSLLYTLDNPNPYGTSANDNFGYSVSIVDTYCVVGAYREDDAGGDVSGKAYIYG